MKKKYGKIRIQITIGKNNLDVLLSRMSGWPLSSFKESYNNKIKNGLSLFKKNEIEQLES